MVEGQESSLNLSFVENLEARFQNFLSEDVKFSCRLIINELMQNSIDHSGAERYYLYAGIWGGSKKKEIHLGVMDMGVSTPAKLQQKYLCSTDEEYLELAAKEGITTRRIRPGGLGLYHTLEHLKSHDGTLTLISRGAQITRYFRNRKVRRQKTKYALDGTWCMARLPCI